jgi:hypothetical protein
MVDEEVKVIDYKFGDLYIQCSCGNDTLEIAGIEGLQITMPATDRDQINLVCPACKHSIKLYFRPAENIEELMLKRDAMLNELAKVREQLETKDTEGAEVDSVEVNEEESTERE